MNEKIKKLAPSVKDKMGLLERTIDEIESRGHGYVRFRTRSKIRCTTVTRVRGFEVFGTDIASRVRTLIKGATNVYPSTDGFSYGYVPATKKNLAFLAELFSSQRYVIDDGEYLDEVIKIAKSKGLPTVFVKKEDAPLFTNEELKLQRLEELRKQLELKHFDEEIAELERQLNGEQEPIKEIKAPAKTTPK